MGLFGTRASLLVDLALSVFCLMPLVLLVAIRWARQRDFRRHRAAQLVLFTVMTVAVVLLEVDVRVEGGTSAIAGRAAMLPSRAVQSLLLVHIGVAVATWLGWLTLLISSWRRFGVAEHPRPLPGAFSGLHRRAGRIVWLGNVFNAVSGAVLYVLAFA